MNTKLLTAMGGTLLDVQNGVVLVELDHGYQRHVTWQYSPEGFYWGHYYNTALEARTDFINRSK